MEPRIMSPDELKQLEDGFGIKVIRQSPLRHSSSTVVALETDRGQRVAKRYPPQYTPEMVLAQQDANVHMRGLGTPTPEFYSTGNGSTVMVFDGSAYILMDRLPGDVADWKDPDNTELVMQGLALGHNGLRGFNPEGFAQPPRFTTFLVDQAENLEGLLPASPKSDTDRYVLGTMPYIKEVAAKSDAFWSGFLSGLPPPRRYILGDYNRESLLAKGKDITGLVVLNHIRPGFLAADVVHTLDLLAIDKETEGMELEERVDWKRMSEAMQAYHGNNPEIAADIPLFPPLLQAKGVADVIQTWRKGYDPDASQGQRDYFNNRVSFFVVRVDAAKRLGGRMIDVLESAIK
ncbi:MAG: phosphotransferase [Nanoarchaeota archaeon]|nr:phosphotransferase [Nanoarchaeota archaeon]